MTMRKMISFMALVVAMTAVSCTKNINDGAPAIDGTVKFEASFAVGTKAVLEPGATESKVAWEANDQVSVLAGEGNYLYAAETAGYTTTLATEATGVPAEGPYYAVYPYDAEAVLAAGVVTTVLPAQQTAVLGSFATHLAVAQANGSKFAFKNVAGLVKVTVDAENVTKIVFEGNSGEVVAGAVNVTVADAPVWEAVAEQGATAVTLVPAEGATLAKGAYYFAVLPQTFAAGFKVTAYKGEDASVIRNVATQFTLERADIIGGKAFGIDGSGTEADPYILKTVQDMKDMRSLAKLGGETWFKMANDIDLAGVNWEPVNWDANFERKIHFDGCNYTISNLHSDETTYGGGAGKYPSLFGVLYGSCKNLKVVDAVIDGTSQAIGIIGGYIGTTGKTASLKNVSVTGEVNGTNHRAGGYAGQVVEATFEDCDADVTVKGKQAVGGFAGKVTGTCSFKGCDVKASVTTIYTEKHQTGGFIGYLDGSTITVESCNLLEGSTVTDGSSVTETVVSSIGGFFGWAGASDKVDVKNTSASVAVNAPYARNVGGFIGVIGKGTFKTSGVNVSGSVKASENAGGFLGYQENGVVDFSSTSTSATVNSGNYSGGFLGRVNTTATLTDCVSTGDVTVVSSVGAFAAWFAKASTVTLTRCSATGNISAKTNVGGVVGIVEDEATGNFTMTDCSYTGKTLVSTGGACGGLVGYLNGNWTIDGCKVETDITSAANVGGLIGSVVSTGTTSLVMTDSYYSGALKATGNYAGGAVGRVNANCKNLLLSGVYTTGTLNLVTYAGGVVGAAMCSNTQKIEKCWSSATINATGQHVGGIVGAVTTALTIENCYTSGEVYAKGQLCGGIVGRAAASVTVQNCYSTAKVTSATSGAAGIVGKVEKASDIQNCIAWNSEIVCSRTANNVWAPGAITGTVLVASTLQECYRKSDLVFTDAAGAMTLMDHDNIQNDLPPYPSYAISDPNQRAYHGIAAEAGATLSSVATFVGWDETVWDLSGDVPVLK